MMNKLIICDKNKELINQLKEINLKSDYFDFIISDKDDVFECKKDYPDARIVTASNPDFKAGGGLDLALANKYPEEWKQAKEFNITDNLFFIISCNDKFKSSRQIIKRALVGVFAYKNKGDFILTGIGTAIAGLNINIFIEELGRLTNANLSNSDLSNSNLSDANLSSSNLSNSDLRDSNLSSSNLKNANLKNANLSHANLSYAYLRGAYLSYANLNFAYLRGAYLRGANLNFVNLNFANLNNANLKNVNYNNNTSFFALQCPEEGSFVGFKKVNHTIIKLMITEDAKRSSATSRKCRCSKTKVLDIYDINDKTKKYKYICSDYDASFIYQVGKIVEVKNFDENRWEECSTGIHFFITEEEARQYYNTFKVR